MRFTYEAIIKRDGDGWSASFPQFPDAATSADTREEVFERAAELLALEVAEKLDEGEALPESQHTAEVATISITLTEEEVDETRYVTQAQAQEILGLSHSRVSALVKTGQLESRIFGRRNMVSIESVNAYAESPRKAGRPFKNPDA